MNDQTAPILSRSQRAQQQENDGHQEKQPSPKNHGGLVVILALLSLFLLASAPVYGLMKNSPKTVTTKSTKTSTSVSSSSSASSQASAKSSSSATSNSQAATSSSQEQAATSSSQSDATQNQQSDDQAAAQAASADTAVLGAQQTLYNFAITHNTSPANIIALNPGLTVQNYPNYAGHALKIK